MLILNPSRCKREGTSTVEESANAPVYDLNGRKVKELRPGRIYVSKGKKFIAK